MSKEVLPDIKNIKSQETYTLPSKGLFYTEEDKIPASITLRRMTTKEDKIRLRNQSEFTIRRDILQACILNEGVDAGKLKLIDANFLLFRLRTISLLTDLYKVHCICPFCNAEFVHELNLNDIPIKYMDKKSLSLLSVKLPIESELATQKQGRPTDIIVNLKLPSLDETIKTAEDFAEYRKSFPDVDVSDYLYNATNLQYIKDINGNRLMKEELADLLDKLDIVDNRKLMSQINLLQDIYGFEDEITAQCPACHEDVIHGLPITSELFTPSN